MNKTIIITEQQSLKLLSENDGVEYVELTPEEYIRYLKMVSYDGRLLYKIPKFRGKKIIVNKQLNLNHLPVKNLGPIVINGGLDISHTNVSTLDNVEIRSKGWISDYDTPLRRIRERKEFLAKVAQQELRRESGEWDAEGELDYIGLCANALFKHLIYTEYEERTPEDSQRLQELYAEKERREEIETETEDDENLEELGRIDDEIGEIERRIDIYNLHYEARYYKLLEFRVLVDGAESKELYAVGDYDDTNNSALEKAEDYIDEVGVEDMSRHLIESNIDEEEFKDYFRDGDEEYVRENLEDIFDEDDFEYDTEVQDRIDEIEEMLEDSENLSEEQYDELNEELEELKDSEKKVSEDLIERKVEEMLNEKAYDMVETAREYGLNLDEFVDKSAMAQDIVDGDGFGHTLNSYNGNEDTVEFQGDTYYIFQIDG
jgi:hypothetical protein